MSSSCGNAGLRRTVEAGDVSAHRFRLYTYRRSKPAVFNRWSMRLRENSSPGARLGAPGSPEWKNKSVAGGLKVLANVGDEADVDVARIKA